MSRPSAILSLRQRGNLMALGARALILVIVLAVLLGAAGGAVTSALLASTTVGASGPAGEPGSDGADGADGAAGAQGPAGERGPVGPQGEAGPRGTAGPSGAGGATGVRGEQGIQGVPGPQGPVGPAGATGPAGPQGVSATNDWLYSSLADEVLTSAASVPLDSTATTGDLGVSVVNSSLHVIPQDGLYRVSTSVRLLNDSDPNLFYLRLNALRTGPSSSIINVPAFARLAERQIGRNDTRDLDAVNVAYLQAGDRVYAEVFLSTTATYTIDGAWLLIEHLDVVE